MALRITRVYTRTGDDGFTGLVGGQRVRKDDPRIAAYGTVDELASLIGMARQELILDAAKFINREAAERLDRVLEFIGNKLFTLGGDLATRLEDRHPMMPVIVDTDIQWLESVCDHYNEELPPLTDFILPGGSRSAAALHISRTVARRAERSVVELSEHEDVGPYAARYLNRLSDAFFVIARWVNKQMGVPDITWNRALPTPTLS